MKVGDLIESDNGYDIVTQIKNMSITEKIPLKDYVEQSLVILHEGEYITVKELVNQKMNEIIENKTVS